MTAALLASLIVLTNAFGSVQVETLGARVVSYAPQGGEEVFAMLPSGYGGVPLCWPWFRYLGPKSDSPKHGIARYREFAVVRRTDGPAASEVELRLDSNAATRKDFPHDFTLTVTVRLDRALSLTMTAKNTGVTPFKVTEAFHPYLRREAVVRLKDEGSGTYRTWDPDAQSHLKTQGLGPEDWRRFICIENGTFTPETAYWLKPGERHTLTRRFGGKSAPASRAP